MFSDSVGLFTTLFKNVINERAGFTAAPFYDVSALRNVKQLLYQEKRKPFRIKISRDFHPNIHIPIVQSCRQTDLCFALRRHIINN